MRKGKVREPITTKFVYKERHASIKTLLLRVGIVLVIFLGLGLVIYTWNHVAAHPHYIYSDDASLPHNETRDLTYIDCVYFTVISITTTGYGDNVIRMKAIQKKLKEHVIVCGYEVAGRTAAQELHHKGIPKNNIVVITNDPHDSEEAAEEGFISLLGDATKENTLKEAQIIKAKSILIATNRDDTNVLIALTAKELNPNIRVVSQSNELENVKLLKKSGADITISPLVTGGSLMATATHQSFVSNLLQDIMTASRGVTMDERKVFPDEVGLKPKHLKGVVVLGVVRNGKTLDLEEMDRVKLAKGDTLLVVKRTGK
jgi:voltage-gated potassium channel Kch